MLLSSGAALPPLKAPLVAAVLAMTGCS